MVWPQYGGHFAGLASWQYWQWQHDVEHSGVNAGGDYTANGSLTLTPTLQTQLQLRTGGKQVLGRQGLFCLNATGQKYVSSAMGYYANIDVYPLAWSAQDLAAGEIQVMGKALGADNNLWLTLPPGADVPLPVKVAADQCTVRVLPTKYELTITANGKDLSTNTPEFCVGQEVDMQAAWNPPLPTGTLSGYHWILSLDFLNSWLPPVTTNGSSYPTISGLTNSLLPTWWYSGGYKYNWCQTSNVFINGQVVTLIQHGDVAIFRPQVQFVDGSPAYPMLYNYYMELGDEHLQQGNMTFGAKITSTTNFPGTANWTQLNNRNTYPNTSQNTDGQFWLDTGQFYNNSTNFPSTPVNPIGTIDFQDAPGVSDVYWDTTITDQFKTYLVFKPIDSSAGGSVWVTLGIVTWGWSATESHWSLTATNVTQATYSDSDAFPQWLYIGTGNHN